MRNRTFIPLLKKETREWLHTYKFLIMAAMFLLFGIASPVAAKYMPEFVASMAGQSNISITMAEPVYKDAVLQFIKNISQMISFVLFFLCMGIVAKEKSTGTAVFVLVKPVSRVKFVLAKLVTLWLAVFICHIVSTIICYFYTLVLFHELPLMPFLVMNGILLLYLCWLTALITFFSMIFNSSGAAGAVSLGTWMVLSLFSTFGELGKYSPVALIALSEALFKDGTLFWQPFAVAGASLLFFVVGGIMIFRKWEP